MEQQFEKGQRGLSLNGDMWAVAEADPGEGELRRFFAEGFPGNAIPASVPGDVHNDLERAGRLKPLYFGLNSQQANWVSRREWWWRREFRISEDWNDRNIKLFFEGVDYKCEIWLNGCKLGTHEGALTGFSFDVSRYLLVDKVNTLTVMVHPGPTEVLDLLYFQRGQGWDHQYAHDQMTRSLKYWKCRTVTGWDWGTPIWTVGIWRDVFLHASVGAALTGVRISPHLATPYKTATLNICCGVEVAADEDVKLHCHVRCQTDASAPEAFFQHEMHLKISDNEISFDIMLDEPRLWWPNGLGEQHLYELIVKVLDKNGTILDEATESFGIRELRYEKNLSCGEDEEYNDLQAIDDWDYGAVKTKKLNGQVRPGLLVYINGQRVFLKGGNWVPCDLLYGRADHSRYERFLRMAAAANFNFLRVWGGGLLEKPEFYELCDRLGLTVVQEFPHAGRRPLETVDALAADAAQIRSALKALSNHPCIIRYGFGNELYLDDSTSLQVKQFKEICREEDPSRPAFDPDPVPTIQRHGPHWFHFNEDYKTYNTGLPLTLGPGNPVSWTEYGAAGMSSVKSIRAIMPAEHQWPIDSVNPYWQWHKAFTAYGRERWLDRENYRMLFGELPDMETECRCSQWAQSEGLRYASQSHRRMKWRRSECTIWTLNEPWPNAAHGCIVEYSGIPKMAYYYVRSSFAAVDISAEYDSIIFKPGMKLPLRFWITSDKVDVMPECTLKVTHMALEGTIVFEENWTFDVCPQGSNFIDISDCIIPQAQCGKVLLTKMELLDRKGKPVVSQLYTFGVSSNDDAADIPFRSLLNMPDADIVIRLDAAERCRIFGKDAVSFCLNIENKSNFPAFYIAVDILGADHLQTYWEDNYFSLSGGEKRQIRVSCFVEDSAIPDISFTAKGWNTANTSG